MPIRDDVACRLALTRRARRTLRRVIRASLAAVLVVAAAACSTLPPGSDYPKTASEALVHPERTRLGRHFDDAAGAHGGMSGFRTIPAGIEGFQIRMQMIDAAERTLDLQYFIFRGDETGRLLTEAVLRAADRGVRVRVLVDDADTEAGDAQLDVIGAHAGVEIRIFNPFAYRGDAKLLRAIEFMFNASRLDYRMHNKLLVVDNAMALLGGRNIGDRYFQVDPESQFADEDVFVAGPIVPRLSATFDAYWNSDMAIPSAALRLAKAPQPTLAEHRDALREESRALKKAGVDFLQRAESGEPLAGIIADRLPLVWAHAQVVCDSPDKKQVREGDMVGHLMQRTVADAAGAVHSELLLVTPFMIPGREGMQLIAKLRRQDVRVRVLTNSLESTPELVAHAGYMHYRLPLLEDGVELYETRSLPGKARGNGQAAALSRFGTYSLHAKLFVFDRRRLFIGSMNFDQRSMHLNTELGLIIDSPELAEQVAQRFAAMVQPAKAYQVLLHRNGAQPPTLIWRTQEGGMPVDYAREPARSAWQRIKVNLLSLLPDDREL
jgi:putative cardiolipin synthase